MADGASRMTHANHNGVQAGQGVSGPVPICPGTHPAHHVAVAGAASTQMVVTPHGRASAILGKLATRTSLA